MGAPSISSLGDQVRCPHRTSASSWLSTDLTFLSLGSLALLCCLDPFWGTTSPSSKSSTGLFFLRFELACSPRSVGGGGEGWRLRGTCVLGTSLEVCPLFLLAIRPFKSVLCFRSMPSSSSSRLVSIWAIINLRECAAESQSRSASKSESSTSLISNSPSSSKRNLSISASRDECVEAISFLGVATPWRKRWMGN